MADIFLSYARAEREKATRVKEMLEGLGLTVFFDVEGLDGGDVFPDVLDHEVKTAGAVVSCWSPHALTRPWVKAECRIGQTRGVLVPVAIEALGDLDVPLEFVGTQYIDLSSTSDGSDAQSMHLVRALARALERPDLLDHEIRAHQQEASSLSSDERAEMEKMRAELDALLAKKQASASFPQPTAEQLKTWDELKTSTNVLALQRFMVWVDGTPLEHRVRQRIAFLEAGEAEPDTPSGKGRMVVPLVSLLALAGLGIGGYMLDPLGWFGENDSILSTPSPERPEGDSGAHLSTDDTSPNGSRSSADADPGNGAEAAARLAEADNAAWADANASATVAAFKAYLANESFTRHRVQAETAVSRHEAAVMRLQTALNAKGFDAGTADGIAGWTTLSAVREFRDTSFKNYRAGKVDLGAIDATPIESLAEFVEEWGKPDSVVSAAPPPERQLAASSSTSAGYPVGKSFTDCSDCPEMVVIPSGSFEMGSNDGYGNEKPVHRVSIGYKLAVGKYEVTWAQWEACVSAGRCDNSGPDGNGSDAGWGKGRRPVINVSWNDAQAYVEWLSRKTGHTYRLLSEAEWEYAARAGTTSAYSFGSSISTSQANYNFHVGETTPVGNYPANPWGLHDMHGNVKEWVEDWYKSGYSHAPSDGSSFNNCADCSRRVSRGGSMADTPGFLRSASRSRNPMSLRYINVGFRVARVLESQ